MIIRGEMMEEDQITWCLGGEIYPFENTRFSLEVSQQQGIHPKKVVSVHSNET